MSDDSIHDILARAPVIPVITIDDPDQALLLAEALLAGGLTVLEITLRTARALQIIDQIRDAFPDALVGAGTVLNPEQFMNAVDAGADFIVSPGFTEELLDCAFTQEQPFLPGVNTASEVMTLLAEGIDAMKFFPAEAAGGIALLKALAAPFPQALFCPTGGISPRNARDYLALPNVACIGGSWMVSPELLRAGRWEDIRMLAQDAANLRTV